MKRFSIDVIWCVLTGGLIALFTFLVLANFGCSATKVIANEANKIQVNSVAITGDAHDIKAANAVVRAKVPVTQPAVKTALATIDAKADDIAAKAGEISTSVDTVTVALTKVQDVTPVWVTTVKYGLMVALLIVVVFVMWRLNLFLLIESGIQFLITWFHTILGKFLGA